MAVFCTRGHRFTPRLWSLLRYKVIVEPDRVSQSPPRTACTERPEHSPLELKIFWYYLTLRQPPKLQQLLPFGSQVLATSLVSRAMMQKRKMMNFLVILTTTESPLVVSLLWSRITLTPLQSLWLDTLNIYLYNNYLNKDITQSKREMLTQWCSVYSVQS